MLPLTLGTAAFCVFVVLAPFAGSGAPSYATLVGAYACAIAPIGLLLHGFFASAARLATPQLLALGASAAILGVLATLPSRPDALAGDERLLPLAFLSLSDTLRVLAAASLGLALARQVTSPEIALLLAVVAAASDLFSVFAGPTRVLVERGSPALDFLVLAFPAFGNSLGFGLGVSDFFFLAFFAAASRSLGLRYPLTLLFGCAATLLATTAGLLLERPLPALPFISVSFILANADRIYASLREGTQR
jgi:hypothetical protein